MRIRREARFVSNERRGKSLRPLRRRLPGTVPKALVLGGEIRIRLAHIDAPELSQPHGKEARKALADLIGDKTVTVVVTGRDRYGRLIATIDIAGTNANHYLVAAGHAWHYVRYSRDRLLDRLQEKAQASGQGLWAGASPAPPWNWRRRRSPTVQ